MMCVVGCFMLLYCCIGFWLLVCVMRWMRIVLVVIVEEKVTDIVIFSNLDIRLATDVCFNNSERAGAIAQPTIHI